MEKKEMDEKLEDYMTKYRLMLCRLSYTYVKNVYDAEDVVQDVFVYIFVKNIVFRNEEHERAWMIQAVVHRSINWVKRASKREVSIEVTSASMLEKMEKDEENRDETDVLEALMQLPPRYKAILHLYYYEEYNTEEIAVLLDIPLSTVKTRMVRGRKRLEKLLKEVYHYEG